jgi:mRNA-degrading endonuclease RelE of RelBE toxin-antitoxin system
MNEVIYIKKAIKQLRMFAQTDQKSIRLACDGLAKMPNCIQVKKLVNHQYDYRLRVGCFRVFFNFDGIVRIVFIEEVKRRNEHTYTS